MYRIAVCEDEPNQCAKLCEQCQDILKELAVEHTVKPFFSAEELGMVLKNGVHFDLLCLDIFLVDQSGMELAQEIRKKDDRVSILFITNSTDFLLEGYEVRPIQYLLKPVKRSELKKAIQTDLRLNYQPRTITLRTRDRTAVLSLPDIRYVESQNHICVFHMVQVDLSFFFSLTQAEQLLSGSRFCLCHNSFLVNLAHIRSISGGKVVLADGVQLPVGRRYARQFRDEFVQFINER